MTTTLTSRANAQATRVELDSSQTKILFAQEWGRRTALGALHELPLSESDCELRFWYGFAFHDARVVVLRRRSGSWTLWQGAMVRRSDRAPLDTLRESPADTGVIAFVKAVGRAATLEQREIARGGVLAERWRALEDSGLLTVAQNPPDGLIRTDSRSYVLETRVGAHYRAVWLERKELPIAPSDRHRERVMRMLNGLMTARGDTIR